MAVGAFAERLHEAVRRTGVPGCVGLDPHPDRLPVELGHRLSADDHERRALIAELMCNLEVDLGAHAETRYADELARLTPLEHEGLVTRHGSRLRLTPLGRVFVRNVASVFDSYLHHAATERPTFSRTV